MSNEIEKAWARSEWVPVGDKFHGQEWRENMDALGHWFLRQGRAEEARECFHKVIQDARLEARNG